MAAAFALSVGAAPTFAAGTADLQGTTLTYTAGDEANAVSIRLEAGLYIVVEPGITAGSGCTQDVDFVTCPEGSVTAISASAGGGDDTITIDSAVTTRSFLDGGPGADTLQCGGNNADRYIPDIADVSVTGCEDDGVAPDATIGSGPPDLSGSATATFEFSSTATDFDHFECKIDGTAPEPCSSPKTYESLADGDHAFEVLAVDRFGNAGSPDTQSWKVDLGAPNLNLDGPSGTIGTNAATFSFSSPDPDIDRFECNIDGSNWVPCQSPTTLSFLPEGPHTFGVRAIDKAGNVGTLVRAFTVALPRGPGILSRPASSLVLIAGRTVKVTRRGFAYVSLNCSGTKECAGSVILDTAKPVRAGRRKRVVRIGRTKFQIPATRTRRVRIHISRRKMRLLRRLRKVSTNVIVKDLDRSGRARTSSRTIVLKAPSRR